MCTIRTSRECQNGTLLYAHNRHIRAYTEGYPVATRSFIIFFQGERSNNARNLLPTVTPWRTLEDWEALTHGFLKN